MPVSESSFLILKKIKVGLCDLHAVCQLSSSSINFYTDDPVFKILGKYIMAPTPIWTAHFINLFIILRASACTNPFAARQRLGENVTAAIKADGTIQTLTEALSSY
jgi:hypothetical protein